MRDSNLKKILNESVLEKILVPLSKGETMDQTKLMHLCAMWLRWGCTKRSISEAIENQSGWQFTIEWLPKPELVKKEGV